METKDNVRIFQKNLDDNQDMQSEYINADHKSDSDSDSDSEICKIMFPKHKRKDNTDTSQELLYQLMRQNEVLSKTQKKIYKLKSELGKEEITARYVKLDLNNAMVKVDEYKQKLDKTNKILHRSRVENWVWRILILLYVVFQLYSVIHGFAS